MYFINIVVRCSEGQMCFHLLRLEQHYLRDLKQPHVQYKYLIINNMKFLLGSVVPIKPCNRIYKCTLYSGIDRAAAAPCD